MSKTYWDHVACLRDFWEATSAQVVVEALEHLIRLKGRELYEAKADCEVILGYHRDAHRLEMASRVLEN